MPTGRHCRSPRTSCRSVAVPMATRRAPPPCCQRMPRRPPTSRLWRPSSVLPMTSGPLTRKHCALTGWRVRWPRQPRQDNPSIWKVSTVPAERMLVIERPGVVAVHEGPPSEGPADGEFEACTVYSGLSAGTELSFLRGSNPFLAGRWDAELGLFRAEQPGLSYPVTQLGYMEVARVGDSRTPVVPSRALVALAYGLRSRFLGNPLVDRVLPLPDDVDPLLGIYVAHMGPICANGLLHAAAELHGTDVRSLADGVRGRHIVVTGAGVVGLLTAAPTSCSSAAGRPPPSGSRCACYARKAP